MRKSVILSIFVLLMMAMSVSAFDYYENYTLNLSQVNYFDNFNRSDGNATGSSMAYGDATWLFGGEIVNETMQLDDNYTTYGIPIMSPDTFYNTTQVLEFDWNRVELLNVGSTFELDFGNNFGNPTIYFQINFLHESEGTSGTITCGEGGGVYDENTWYHLKVIIDKENHLASAYLDGSPLCENVSYTESAGDMDFWSVFGSTGAYASVNQFDNVVNYNGTASPYAPPCTPDWVCSDYEPCEEDDLARCSAVTDLNSCGVPFEGDIYGDFTPQVCDFCLPDWVCSGYGDCLENDTQICNSTTDLNDCYGLTYLESDLYSGNFSEFSPQACDFCIPDWNCDGWGECVNGTQDCNSVNDLNLCSEEYLGNYSEFPTQNCTMPGYTPNYATGDFLGMTNDAIGNTLMVLIQLAGVVVIVGLVVYGGNKLKGIKLR